MKNISTIPSFETGEVTLFLGEDTGGNITKSMQDAYAIACAEKHGKVLYINTVQTARKMCTTIRQELGLEVDPPTEKRIDFVTASIGNLAMKAREIEDMVCHRFFKVIVINSWEFANKHSRYRDEMIFMIKSLLDIYGVTVLVYAQNDKKAQVGVIGRGMLGKLAAIADRVITLPVTKKAIPVPVAMTDTMVTASGEIIAPEVVTVIPEIPIMGMRLLPDKLPRGIDETEEAWERREERREKMRDKQ